MNTLLFFKEVQIESKSQDLLNQIRNKLANSSAGIATDAVTELPRRRTLHSMENKNWEIVEKSDGTHWVRFLDEVSHSEFMLLL